MNKSIVNSYRLKPAPAQQQTPPTIAGRIVPVNIKPDPRPALVVLAVLVLPLLAVGVVVYAAQSVQAAPVATPAPASEAQAPPPVPVAPTPQAQATPQAPQARPQVVQPAPQAAPVQAQAAQPTARKPQAPQVAPPIKEGGPQGQAQRPAASAPAPTPAGPQERLLSRPCVYPSAPQGTIIRGYFTDAQGVKRDAVCRADGWKAVQ